MRPGSPSRGVVASLLGLVLALSVAGCSSSEDDPAPEVLSAVDRAACVELVAGLPATLAGQERRTDAGGATEAAYGDPEVVVRCGVAEPAGFDPTAVPGPSEQPPCIKVNGVGWYLPTDQADGDRDATFTAVSYAPRVSVRVPRDYLPEGGAAALAELAPVVKSALRPSVRCNGLG